MKWTQKGRNKLVKDGQVLSEHNRPEEAYQAASEYGTGVYIVERAPIEVIVGNQQNTEPDATPEKVPFADPVLSFAEGPDGIVGQVEYHQAAETFDIEMWDAPNWIQIAQGKDFILDESAWAFKEDQQYGFRAWVRNNQGKSLLSNEQWIMADRMIKIGRRRLGLDLPVSPPSGETWFEDGFESGDKSKTSTREDDSWQWLTGNPVVDSEAANNGTYSLKFTFGPDSLGSGSNSEQRFSLGKEFSEVWLSYWILYPANYIHRDDPPDNNKFMQLHRTPGGVNKNMLTIESIRAGDDTSDLKRFLSETRNPDGSNNFPSGTSGASDFIGPGATHQIELGQWTKVGVRYKAGSDGVTKDGRFELWINDVLYNSLDWEVWEPDNEGRITGGYLLGAANSGFTDETVIRIDEFKVYDSNPGWDS